MISQTERLIEALRDELKEYGEMLALLDQQQDQVVNRASEDLVQTVAFIEKQRELIAGARRHRDECVRALAHVFRLASDAPLGEVVPRLSGEYQPLVNALVKENNDLLVRVQRRARQNHLLLKRSLDLMQDLVHSMFPQTRSEVYNQHGRMPSATVPAHTLYEAIG